LITKPGCYVQLYGRWPDLNRRPLRPERIAGLAIIAAALIVTPTLAIAPHRARRWASTTAASTALLRSAAAYVDTGW